MGEIKLASNIPPWEIMGISIDQVVHKQFMDEYFSFLDNISYVQKKHLCATCEHIKGLTYPDGTTLDRNSCDYAFEEMKQSLNDDEWLEWVSSDDVLYWHYNDRRLASGFATEDNGGGYWIVSCPHYKKIDFRSYYHGYLKSDVWKRKRKSAIEKAGYKCSLCGTAKNLNVHHITYENVPFEEDDDLIVVCRQCHEKLHENDAKRKGE